MIIFGTNVRNKELGTGEFNCPKCRARTPYKHMSARRYFTLYFIPIFPVGGPLGEFVQCTRCGTSFEMAVLNYQPPSDADRYVAAARADLRAGMPLQMARRKLVNAGLADDVARDVVRRAGSVSFRECAACGLTYHESIEKCSNCGAPLRPTMTDGL